MNRPGNRVGKMKNRPKTLTIDELTALTGFDRRTIAYYVQEGLLPKVGRRGRLTRYPTFIADRLLFVKRLREAEEAGELPAPMTLAEIRDVFESRDPQLVAEIAAGKSSFDALADDPMTLEESLEGLIPAALLGRAKQVHSSPPDEMASREVRMSMMLEETDEPDLFVPGRAGDPMAVEESFVDACEGPPASREKRSTRSFDADRSMMRVAASGPPPVSEEELSELLTRLSRATTQSRRSGEQRAEKLTRAAITPGLSLSARELDESQTRTLERTVNLLRRLIKRRGD